VAAFVISQASPMAGQPVTVTNVSRDLSGHPIGALLNFGDSSTTTNVAAGGSVVHTYADAGSITMTLLAADAAGNSLSVARPVVVGVAATPTPLPSDFTLSLAPSSQQLSPGQSTTFVVSLDSVNGFTAPVALTVSGLPTGVTASFSPTSVTLPGTSVLTISATNAATANSTPAQFTVSATGGGITHATSGGVTVNFGLVPECFGAISGTVTDAQTGDRLAFVRLQLAGGPASPGTLADANGHFLLGGLPLGPNNGAIVVSLVAEPGIPNYFGATNTGVVVACDQATKSDFALVAIQTITLSGVVHVGIPDPNDLTQRRSVVASSETIAGATITFASPTFSALAATAANGAYHSGPLPLGPGNLATPYVVTVSSADYWSEQQGMMVGASQNATADLVMVKQCRGSISGTLTLADTLQPAPNVAVSVAQGADLPVSVVTDAQGHFTFPALLLGYRNSSTTYKLNANFSSGAGVANYLSASLFVPLLRCGDDAAADVALAPMNLATLQGHVYDRETGAPLAGVAMRGNFVYPPDAGLFRTDASGAYSMSGIFLGAGAQSLAVSVQANPDEVNGYWSDFGFVTLQVGQPATLDLHLLKMGFGRVAGVVRDATSHQALAGVQVIQSAAGQSRFTHSGPDGSYVFDRITLGRLNRPVAVGITATLDGFWGKVLDATVVVDQTTTIDLDLIKVCDGASIVGTVINLTTQVPIANAHVASGSYLQPVSATTDDAGNFSLRNVGVGDDNSPISVFVTASADGFLSQTKTVTIFCGATIVVDFGRTSSAVGPTAYVPP